MSFSARAPVVLPRSVLGTGICSFFIERSLILSIHRCWRCCFRHRSDGRMAGPSRGGLGRVLREDCFRHSSFPMETKSP